MGKFQDVIDRRGYRIQPIKTVKIPTAEEYLAAARERDVMKAQEQVAPKVAGNVLAGGMIGAGPGARMASIFPEYQGLYRQTRDRNARLEDMRKAHDDLYELEGEYGLLANDAMPEEDRARYQARYDEIMAQYGKGTTSESLWEQMEQLQAEIDATQDQMTDQRNWAEYSAMSAEEQLAFRRYAEAMSGGAVSFGSDGNIHSPVLEIQAEPEIRAIISKYGKDRVEKIAETLKRDMNRALSQEASALGQEVGEKLGFGAIPVGVTAGLFGTPANLIGLANEAITGTGQYRTSDPYHAGGMLSTLSQGIGAGGAKTAPRQMVDFLELAAAANPYATEMGGAPTSFDPKIYEATRGTKAGEVIDAVGSGAYQAVNTAVDSTARAYLGGSIFGAGSTGAKAFSLGLAGARSFGDTYNDVSAKGGTPGQAAVLGVFNAGTEIATEYIPLEEWWKVAENGSDGVKAMLKAAAKQGAMEMTQEEIGFLATSMMEFAVLREKSEFQVLKRELMAMGYSSAAAERMMWEEFGKQAAGVALTSFFSGLLSEAGAEAYRSLMPGTMAATPAQEGSGPSQGETRADGATPPQSAPQTAPLAQGSLDGGDVSEVGTVPQTETPLTKAQDYYRQNGIVSNSMAEAILADDAALTELKKLTPVQLGGTKSQDRAAVKAAVARISGEAELSGEGTVQAMADAMTDIEQRQSSQAMPTQEREADMDGAIGAAVRGEAYGEAASSVSEAAAPQISVAATTEETQLGQEHGAVGAAEYGFSGNLPYETLLTEDNLQRPRANDARPWMEVPKRDADGNAVSAFVSNTAASRLIPDEFTDVIKQLTQTGMLSIIPQANADTLQRAVDGIIADGDLEKSLRDIIKTSSERNAGPDAIARAMVLYQYHVSDPTAESQRNAADLYVALQKMSTTGGRSLQLYNLFRKMTPEGQMAAWKAQIADLVKTVTPKGKDPLDVTISGQTEKDFLEVATPMETAVTDAADTLNQAMEKDGLAAAEEAVKQSGLTPYEVGDAAGAQAARSVQQKAEPTTDDLYSAIMTFVRSKTARVAGRARRQNALRALRQYYQDREGFETAWHQARRRAEIDLAGNDAALSALRQFLDTGGMAQDVMDAADAGSVSRQALREAARGAGVDLSALIAQSVSDQKRAFENIRGYLSEAFDMDEGAAEAMAAQLQETFFADLAERQSRRLRALFGERQSRQQPTESGSLPRKFRELYDLGAFTKSGLISREALRKVFGADGLTLSQEVLSEYRDASDARRIAVEERIISEIADQLPTTLWDVLDQWRYTAMLTNPSTHLRNISSTFAQLLIQHALKDPVAIGVESITSRSGGGRSKAILNPVSKRDRGLVVTAWGDYRAVSEDIKNGGRYGDAKSRVQDAKQAWKINGPKNSRPIQAVNKVLGGIESATDLNSALMDAEDSAFGRTSYTLALAGYMKANGLQTVTAEARAYAIRQAQEATFHDDSVIYRKLKGLSGNRPFRMTVPFLKTHANTTSRMIEYSPYGFAKGGIEILKQAVKGEAIDSGSVDDFSKGIVGAAMWGIGIWLAKEGILRLSGVGSEEKREYEERMGSKPWTVCLDGKYFDVRFLNPAVNQIMTGAALYEALANADGDLTWEDVLDIVYTVSDPIISSSPAANLDGFMYAIRSMEGLSTGELVGTLLTEILQSYVGQFVPSMLRSYASAKDNTARKYSSDGDFWSNLFRDFSQATPEGRAAEYAKYDPWGNVLKQDANGGDDFLSVLFRTVTPSKQADVHTASVDAEVERLLDLGYGKAVPSEGSKKVTLHSIAEDGSTTSETVTMTPEQWDVYMTIRGEASLELARQITETRLYQNMDDASREALLAAAYDYANELGKAGAVPGYTMQSNERLEGLYGTGADVVSALSVAQVDKQMSGALDGLAALWNAGKSYSGSVENLNGTLALFHALSEEEQSALRDSSGGRLAAFLRADAAGIPTDLFAEAYSDYYGIGKTVSDETMAATEWANSIQALADSGRLTKDQTTVLRDSLKYWRQMPAEPGGKFDEWVDLGISGEDRIQLVDLLANIKGTGALDEESGKANVRTVDRMDAIADASFLTEAERISVMSSYLTESQAQKMDQLIDAYDLTASEYSDVYRVYLDNDKKAEMIAEWVAMGFTWSQAEGIYRLYHPLK